MRPVPGFRNAQRAGFACIGRSVRPCAVRSGAARCQRGAPACLVCIACFARILALLAPLKRCSPVLGNSFHPLNETSMKFFEGPRELINSLFFSGGNIFSIQIMSKNVINLRDFWRVTKLNPPRFSYLEPIYWHFHFRDRDPPLQNDFGKVTSQKIT